LLWRLASEWHVWHVWHFMAGKRVYEFVAAAQGFSAILWRLGSPSLGFPNEKLFRRAGFQLLSLHLQKFHPMRISSRKNGAVWSRGRFVLPSTAFVIPSLEFDLSFTLLSESSSFLESGVLGLQHNLKYNKTYIRSYIHISSTSDMR
jgi:hypothetical protein